ncbi:MAG: patatin-like phospholipase family protein [Thermodesulfobacteriota bacterium]
MLTQGCTTARARHPVPPAYLEEARVVGLPDVRGYGDAPDESLFKSAVESVRQELAAQPGKPAGVFLTPTVAILALSGGGADGAFGAGLICGWTAHGDRPRFKLVTGISTGSLIAPFAFLGPEYDAKLKEVYTTISTKDVYVLRNLLKMLRSDSLADTWPLAKLAASYVDEAMLQAIAAEHKKGRRLFIGTTNLDAQRLVIWDMGALAASGHPHALKLFHQIMLASAAIPVMFPPVYLEVEAGGRRYDELHVDGGAVAEVITYEYTFRPFAVWAEARGADAKPRHVKLYIVRNSKNQPEWGKTEAGLKGITERALSTIIKYQGIGDLYRIFTLSKLDGVDFNLAFIPGDFNVERKEEFDRHYMNKLFDRGYELGRSGYPWLKYPPGLKRAIEADKEARGGKSSPP